MRGIWISWKGHLHCITLHCSGKKSLLFLSRFFVHLHLLPRFLYLVFPSLLSTALLLTARLTHWLTPGSLQGGGGWHKHLRSTGWCISAVPHRCQRMHALFPDGEEGIYLFFCHLQPYFFCFSVDSSRKRKEPLSRTYLARLAEPFPPLLSFPSTFFP